MTRKARLRFIKQNGCKCYYCGITAILSHGTHPAKNSATIDHLWPMSRTGDNSRSNKVVACYECNQKKADRSLYELLPHG